VVIVDRCASAIDDMVDGAAGSTIEPDSDEMLHGYPCSCRRFDGIVELHKIGKVAIHADTLSMVRSNVVRNLAGWITVLAVLRPTALTGNVVWDFRLVEIDTATVAVPQSLESLKVLDEQPIGCHIVAVDDEAIDTG